MGKVRRGNYMFMTWVGDHPPRHVHVYRAGRLVLKWDLDNWSVMEGVASRRIRRILRELVDEGQL